MTAAERFTSGAPRSWPALAHLYALATLDPLIEIVHELARDFGRGSREYKDLPDDVLAILKGFEDRVGADPDWPSAAQRGEVYTSLTGPSFNGVCIGLRSAATTLAERGQGSSDDPLRDVFGDAAARAHAYFQTLDDQALGVAARRAEAMLESAVKVLRTSGVADAFGVRAAPGDWPIESATDGSAAYLVETIGDTLGVFRSRPYMSQHRFMLLQRVASHGARALAGLSGDDPAGGDRYDTVAQAAYGWEKGLQELLVGLDVRRAWLDPAYRDALSGPEKAMLPPHPSGEISLDNTDLNLRMASRANVSLSTYTINNICCSTGDLPCGSGSIIVAIGESRLA